MLALYLLPENQEYLIELDTPSEHSSEITVQNGSNASPSVREDSKFSTILDFVQTMTDKSCAEIIALNRVGAGVIEPKAFSAEVLRITQEGLVRNRSHVAEKIGMGFCIKGLRVLSDFRSTLQN